MKNMIKVIKMIKRIGWVGWYVVGWSGGQRAHTVLGGAGGVKYRMLHIPGILDCTYHLHVSCLCAQGSSIAEYLDYSP